MKVSILNEHTPVDALAVICFEAGDQPAADSELANQSGWIKELRASGEFTGKLYETVTLYWPQGASAKRLIVIGGGKPETFSQIEMRRIAGVLVRLVRGKGVKSIALSLEEKQATPVLAAAAVEGALLANWEPDRYKSDPKKGEKQVDSFTVVAGNAVALAKAVERGRIVAEGQNFARDLINEPGNKLTPAVFAEQARTMAAAHGLACDVLDCEAMQKLGMGALLGVAQGSANPPFLIVLKYQPEKPAGSDRLALIGKGVTFDTGGVSIKSAEGMEKMKYDMAGGAAVIGAMQAIAQLKPAIPVTAYVPTVENAVGGNAQRPGDIVTTLSGKTVEVLNTDAEGRLILADAITYANRNGATHLVDAATLTGAIAIALGHYNVGVFTNNQALLEKLLKAAGGAGEKMWQLPMDDDYKDYLKSVSADLPNIGGRYGGSITAAWFLKEFADPTPWVHLDIASTAWLDDAKAWLAKGPSGVAVRSFVELACTWAGGN